MEDFNLDLNLSLAELKLSKYMSLHHKASGSLNRPNLPFLCQKHTFKVKGQREKTSEIRYLPIFILLRPSFLEYMALSMTEALGL